MTTVNQRNGVRRALIVVDVQNDFCEGGSLAVDGGTDVASDVTRWIEERGDDYEVIVATADWHTPHTHGHFAEDGDNPDFNETWPVHCMADTDGSSFHPNLKLPEGTQVFRKGQTEASYSGFDGATVDDVPLVEYLNGHAVTHLDIVGIAFDFCVAETAKDAADSGFDTNIIESMTASVSAESEMSARSALRKKGVTIL